MDTSPATQATRAQPGRQPRSPGLWPLRSADLPALVRLLLLGALVGLASWPLNLVDGWQDQLLRLLPGNPGGPWTAFSLLLALSPLVVVPLLLTLQRGPLASGAGSGIPQTIACLERPGQADRLLGWRPTATRLGLWTLASLALLPLGREGPLVQVGAAVAQALRRRAPRLSAALGPEPLLAVGAAAGLAGGFNSPLMGVLFLVEELTASVSTNLIWPALVVCSAAALASNLAGMPLFPLGLVPGLVPEWQQLVWALPIGAGGGLIGGLFARGLLISGRWLKPRLAQAPLIWGLAIGGSLAALAVLSGGWSGGDGELLMRRMLEQRGALPAPDSPLGIAGWLSLLLARVVGPILALACGIPGGLIDPAFSFGALFGAGSLQLLGGDPLLGVALGMAAGLGGATQLPLMTVVFALRLAGDQQWLFGILLSAVVASYVGRRLQPQPIYHALAGDLRQACHQVEQI
ncbi:MAG: chloride channel protein [Cyanobium sp. M30B3]|nr:MAG: chloride channel protein [Cyanobium sp. M30B3]